MTRPAWGTTMALMLGMVLLAPGASAATPRSLINRIEASGVWDWTTRVQHVNIAHRSAGELWRHVLWSVERWEPDGETYRDFALIEAPPIMRGVRLLHLAGPRVRSGRWIYIPEFRRPRRLPPFRRGAYLDHVFRPLALLQELPLRLRRSHLLRHETSRTGAEVLALAPTRDTPDALELHLAGTPLLLYRIVVRDSEGQLTHTIRVDDYRTVQTVPTPHRLRIAGPDRSFRAAVEFTNVQYDAPVPDTIFSVPSFGESSIRLGWERR